MALPINKELILEKHCPSMSLLYLDDMGRAFRKRILTAMEEYANAKSIAGATAENERAQKLAEALQIISDLKSFTDKEGFVKNLADTTLRQWNTGKADRPCPHCGKELNRDRNLCCRECGKEVVKPEDNVSIGEHITYCHGCGFPVDECNCIIANPKK